MLELLSRRELFGESRDERSIFDLSFVTLLIVSSLLKELCKSRKRKFNIISSRPRHLKKISSIQLERRVWSYAYVNQRYRTTKYFY